MNHRIRFNDRKPSGRIKNSINVPDKLLREFITNYNISLLCENKS